MAPMADENQRSILDRYGEDCTVVIAQVAIFSPLREENEAILGAVLSRYRKNATGIRQHPQPKAEPLLAAGAAGHTYFPKPARNFGGED